MDRIVLTITGIVFSAAALITGCDSKQPVVSEGREAVKEVVTQPFNTLDAAKDSLNESEAKRKEALESVEKEFKN